MVVHLEGPKSRGIEMFPDQKRTATRNSGRGSEGPSSVGDVGDSALRTRGPTERHCSAGASPMVAPQWRPAAELIGAALHSSLDIRLWRVADAAATDGLRGTRPAPKVAPTEEAGGRGGRLEKERASPASADAAS